MITPAVLQRDLTNFARIAHTEAWAAIGGEPLLHPQLRQLLEIAEEVLPSTTRIEIWTNGQKLKGRGGIGQMPEGFYGWAFDRLVVSAYPGVLTDADLVDIETRCLETGTEFHLKDERHYPNFTQLLTTKPEEMTPEATQLRYERCWFKTYSRVLDHGYFYRCCTSPFIPQLLQGRPVGSDGLKIDRRTTSEDLQRFLDQPQAMESCRTCAGRNTPEAYGIPWGEERDPQAWLAKSGGQAQ